MECTPVILTVIPLSLVGIPAGNWLLTAPLSPRTRRRLHCARGNHRASLDPGNRLHSHSDGAGRLFTVLVIPAVYNRATAAIAAAVIKQVRSTFMKKNYIDITKRISGDLRKLRQDIPDTMKAFSALAQAAGREGALDKKTKELIALAIAIATRCDGCIGFHMEALVRLGATRQEVEETLGMTIYMGGGPSLMYAADAISAFEEFQVQLGVAA
jgi:AhpD family alkylhydroperoxidase